MAKLWIARTKYGLFASKTEPHKNYFNPFDKNDVTWTTGTPVEIELDPSLFPEVTIENSPKLLEVELTD